MPGEGARERLLDSLATLTDDDSSALIQEARRISHERVLAVLVDAMTETTLDRIAAVLSAREAPAAEPSQHSELEPVGAQPEPVGALGWYVYGVAGSDGGQLESLPGVEPEYRTTTLVHEDLAAVVSQVQLADYGEQPLREHLADMSWLERTARAHEEVLDRTAQQRTLIPMRMCSVYRDRTGVLDMLAREQAALRVALAQLDGRAEWGVKVFADIDAAALRVPLRAPDSMSSEGTAYLLKRRDERQQRGELDQRLTEACETIHTRLSAVAADSLVAAPQRPEVSDHPGEMVLNGVYLVDDDLRDRFATELEALRSELSPLALDLVLTGPWPAYNFVPGTIGAAW